MESESSENEENNSFIRKNEIIFKKYKVIKKLGSGSFGDIYLGISLLNNSYVAIKTETKKIPNQHLETEAYFLYLLKSVGIPEILSFGKTKDYNILIEPFLGKSLYQLYEENNRYFKISDICLMGIQILDRLEWIHSKNIIHRDIKPDNFLIGNKDPNTIYLIDFGLSSKYRSSKTGKHKKFGFTGKLTGTTKYSSANTIRGVEQSRKDDLISVAYMIIFFMKGNLPWQDIDSEDEANKFTKIYLMKKNIKEDELCAGLPTEIYKFLKYVQNLDFEEKPNYDYLRSLFIDLLKKKGITYNERLVFSWVNPKISKCKSPSNMINRKSNFHKRLYKKIENNLEYSTKNLYKNNPKERKMKIIDYKRINGIKNFRKYIPLSQKILLNNYSKNINGFKIGTNPSFDYINNISHNFEGYGKRNKFYNSEYNERLVNNFDKDLNQPLSQYNMSTEKISKKYNYTNVLNNKINLTNDRNDNRIISNNIMENRHKLFNKKNYRLNKSFKPEKLYVKDMMSNYSNLYKSTYYNSNDNSKILKINKKPIINQLLVNNNYFNRKINNKKFNNIKNNTINTSDEFNYLKINKNASKNIYNQTDYHTIQSNKDIKNRNLKKYYGIISNNSLINKDQNFNENLYKNRLSNFNININPLK